MCPKTSPKIKYFSPCLIFKWPLIFHCTRDPSTLESGEITPLCYQREVVTPFHIEQGVISDEGESEKKTTKLLEFLIKRPLNPNFSVSLYHAVVGSIPSFLFRDKEFLWINSKSLQFYYQYHWKFRASSFLIPCMLLKKTDKTVSSDYLSWIQLRRFLLLCLVLVCELWTRAAEEPVHIHICHAHFRAVTFGSSTKGQLRAITL